MTLVEEISDYITGKTLPGWAVWLY